MKIAISGSTGYIGSHLSEYLKKQGHEIIPLTRNFFQPGTQSLLTNRINGCDIIVNLAGAPINHRWSKTYKQILHASRIIPTQMLVKAINTQKQTPALFISASAVGFYSSQGCYDEYNNQKGSGFLAELCDQWEREAQKVHSQVRLVITRFGIVLSDDGGAFKRYARMGKMKISITLGSGKQSFSWITLHDLLRAINFIINTTTLHGTFNLVAPQTINNTEFSQQIAHYYHTLLNLKIPVSLLRLFYGEATSFLTDNLCVSPTRLQEAGFTFNEGKLEQFLK